MNNATVIPASHGQEAQISPHLKFSILHLTGTPGWEAVAMNLEEGALRSLGWLVTKDAYSRPASYIHIHLIAFVSLLGCAAMVANI